MSWLQRIGEDISAGRNLDVYVTVPVAILISIIGIIGSNATLVYGAIVSVLSLLSFSLLNNRHQNEKISKVINELASQIPFTLTAQVKHSKSGVDIDDADVYKVLIDAVRRAEKSILAVALAKPSDLKPTANREHYYTTLKNILEEKYNNRSDFTFRRIFQVDKLQGDAVTSQQMDLLTLEHCEHLLDLRRRGGINIFCNQITAGISPISFLIIDDKEIIFLMSTVILNPDAKIEAHQQIGTIILFSDPEQVIIKEMRTLFDRLAEQASIIARIIRL